MDKNSSPKEFTGGTRMPSPKNSPERQEFSPQRIRQRDKNSSLQRILHRDKNSSLQRIRQRDMNSSPQRIYWRDKKTSPKEYAREYCYTGNKITSSM